MTLQVRVAPVSRSRLFFLALLLPALLPALASADQGDAMERFQAGAESYERAVAAHARLTAGTVSLGDDHADSTSSMTPFAAVAAQLDFMRVGPIVLHTQLSYGRLATPADYPAAVCPRIRVSGCTVWLQRAASWSSLSVGGSWVRYALPWTVTGRVQTGALLRRYGAGYIIDRDLSTGSMTFHPTVVGDVQHRARTISPLLAASAGIGRRIAGQWSIGAELELQASGLIGGPPYYAAATSFIITWHWRS